MKAKMLKAFGFAQKLSRKAKILALVAVCMLLSVQASALEIVTQAVDAEPVFNPSVITTPIGTGVISGYCAIAGVLLIAIGCGWLLRIVSQKRS